MTASVKQASKITKNEFYQGNYVSRTVPVNVFHSWLLCDENSRSLLTPSFLSHCQASLPASTLCLPAERALLVNASELEMSHSTLSRAELHPKGALCSGTKEHGFPRSLTFSAAIMTAVLIKLREKSKYEHWVRCGELNCRNCEDTRSSPSCGVWCLFYIM